jgi:hypothetical protein
MHDTVDAFNHLLVMLCSSDICDLIVCLFFEYEKRALMYFWIAAYIAS